MTNRRKFIVDVVKKYKKDYPDEYKEFLEIMKRRRAMASDKKFASFEGATEMRNAVSIPDKVMNIMSYVFDGVTEEKFLYPKGEMKWFIKKFPEFMLANSY